MGAGRRSVCFEQADVLAELLLPASVQTKNTFVHFAKRDPAARRETCVARLACAPEASSRCASRARTCQPDVACALAIPDLRRGSLVSEADSEACDSPASPAAQLCVCLETPTVLFVPFQASPRSQVTPNLDLCNSPMAPASPVAGFMSPMAPASPMAGCVSPMVPASPMAGCVSPNFAPCHSPMDMCVPPMPQNTLSPNFAPCNSPMVGCVSPMVQSPNFAPCTAPMLPPNFAPCGQSMDGCLPPTAAAPAECPNGGRFVVSMPLDCAAFVAQLNATLPLAGPEHVPLPFAAQELFPAVWQVLEPKPKGKPCIPAKANEVTLMLRHLPLQLTPDELLAELQQFVPHIDFYYLPTNFETKNNLGYAFLNFTDKAVASEFTAQWLARGLAELDELAVVEARVQGFAENVNRFRNSSVMPMLTAEFKPRIFDRGVPKPFPAPDKAVPPVGPRFRPTDAERPRTASDASRSRTSSEESVTTRVPLARPPCVGASWPTLRA